MLLIVEVVRPLKKLCRATCGSRAANCPPLV